jgi:hypothetical protein
MRMAVSARPRSSNQRQWLTLGIHQPTPRCLSDNELIPTQRTAASPAGWSTPHPRVVAPEGHRSTSPGILNLAGLGSLAWV